MKESNWTEISPVRETKLLKWTKPDQELVGEWQGVTEGKYGPLGAVLTEEARVLFPLHKMLEERLHGIAEGTRIKIVYKGDATSKSGFKYKLFAVFQQATETKISSSELPARPPMPSPRLRALIGNAADLVSRMPDDDDLPF